MGTDKWLPEQQLGQSSPAVLAYVGDAVYELHIRRMLAINSSGKINVLHRQAVDLVNASTQAKLFHYLDEHFLSEEEKNMARRGRNYKSGHVPKNADVVDYRYSTGLECLIGYLHLKGEDERVAELISQVGHLN